MVDNHLWAASLRIARTSSQCSRTGRGAIATPTDHYQPHPLPIPLLRRCCSSDCKGIKIMERRRKKIGN